MQHKVLINFSVSEEKKALYSSACADLGISISEICRRALDESVSLSQKLKSKSIPASSTSQASPTEAPHARP